MRRLALPLLLSLLHAPLSASATQVLALDLDQMVDRAHVIVLGKVTEVRSERLAEAPGRIHTLITVQAAEVVRSDRNPAAHREPYTFSVPGGKVGHIGQLVPGAPRFDVGQEVLLLLARNPATKRLQIVGFSQGRYRVERPAPGPAELVSDRAGLGLMVRAAGGGLTGAPAALALDRRPLDATLQRIRERVGSN